MKPLAPALAALLAVPVLAAAQAALPEARPAVVFEAPPAQPAGLEFEPMDNQSASLVIPVTAATFEAEVTNSALPVFMDVYATWCGPCKFVAPTVEELAQAYKGKVKFVKLDVDAEKKLAEKLNIESMPTFIFFNKLASGGKNTRVEVARLKGADTKDASANRTRLEEAIKKHLLP